VIALPDRAAERAAAAECLGWFCAMGAEPVEADILLPAGALLDLYGEDIRARAYVTHDPALGEMMLRPDFTVPVVQAHMAGGAEPARYAYAGLVFRRQEDEGGRPREYFQAGYEVFARTDPAAAEAEVFALFARLLDGTGAEAVTGDVGVLAAAVAGLATTPARRAALARHIWRPERFRALLHRFAGEGAPDPARAALIAAVRAEGAAAVAARAGAGGGLRGPDEVAARLAALVEDSDAAPLPAAQVDALEAVLALDAPLAQVPGRLAALAGALPALEPAAARIAARAAALAAHGLDPARLRFAGSHGRAGMEYYDGFVFSFADPAGPGRPPLATGGRYDALCARLGGGRAIPAVGGVVRPGPWRAAGGLAPEARP